MWIWAAMLDLKVHLLHDKAVRDFASPQLALLVLGCVAITAASFGFAPVLHVVAQPGQRKRSGRVTNPGGFVHSLRIAGTRCRSKPSSPSPAAQY